MQTPEIRKNPTTGLYEQVTVVPFDADQARADLKAAQDHVVEVEEFVNSYRQNLERAEYELEAANEAVAFRQAVVNQLDVPDQTDTAPVDETSSEDVTDPTHEPETTDPEPAADVADSYAQPATSGQQTGSSSLEEILVPIRRRSSL